MLIDSNILIYSLNSASPKCEAAQTFIQSQKQPVLAQQNIFETLRVITHRKNPSPMPIKKAVKAITGIAKFCQVIQPTDETDELAFELIKKYQITGTEVFDAYLVATALSNQISAIATDNIKHLHKYQEIKIVNPF